MAYRYVHKQRSDMFTLTLCPDFAERAGTANTTTATPTESYFQPSHRLWSSAEPSEMSGLRRNSSNEYGQTCKSPPVTFFR